MNCEQCRIGLYHVTSAPYLHWLDDQLMVVPKAPAYICDMCGHMHYDPNFIKQLQYLVDQPDALPDRDHLRQPAVREAATSWQLTRGSN